MSQYRTGATAYELADKFSVHRVTVSKLLRSAGVSFRLDGLNEVEIHCAEELYAQGWSLAKVGDRFGVAGSTVYRAFKARGIPTRDSQGKPR